MNGLVPEIRRFINACNNNNNNMYISYVLVVCVRASICVCARACEVRVRVCERQSYVYVFGYADAEINHLIIIKLIDKWYVLYNNCIDLLGQTDASRISRNGVQINSSVKE